MTGRNIIVCCDGTQNSFGTHNTNVVKLVMVLPLNTDQQLSYYDPGVGTLAAPGLISWGAKQVSLLLGLAFGHGLTRNIADAYEYLMKTYQDGDRVFLFGFSRGAYTVRALAGLLHHCGLLDEGSENLIPYAIQLFKKPFNDESTRVAREFKETFSRECKPHFVGVWDTVSSVGWIYDPVTLPFTYRDPDIRTIRHAVSLDERRAFFRQNLFAQDVVGQDCRQEWFPGVHSDVGGGYPEARSGLAKLALRWIVDEAQKAGMLVDQKKYQEVVLGQTQGGAPSEFVPPSAEGPKAESLKGLWWVAEVLPRRYTTWKDGRRRVAFRIPLGQPRRVPTGSIINASVAERMLRVPGYRPRNLPDPKDEPKGTNSTGPRRE